MTLQPVSFEETRRFSSTFLDYINNKAALKPFFKHPPKLQSFQQAIAERKFDNSRRKVLVDTLLKQYQNIETSDKVRQNIQALLEPTTFTVTTGHQLNILTGPMFFVYKIIAAINLAKALKSQYPDHNFVPVYWMASEDHDFDEINHFRLFGKTHTWNQEAGGPVGKLDTSTLKPLLEEIPDLPPLVSDAYGQAKNLSEATVRLVNQLYGEHGLVILDADERELKAQFKPFIMHDVFQNMANQLVEQTTEKLEKAGYKGQIFPREINFFYMDDGSRERIVKDGDHFRILNMGQSLTKAELEKLVEESPEKFSPNVVMRPVYQEEILPNLAYIGGPAEMAYWLQLKPVFDHYSVSFPILFPRLFGMIIQKPVLKKMEKNHLSVTDIFKDFHMLKENIILAGAEDEIELSEELKALEDIYRKIKEKAGVADKSLEGLVISEQKKTEKSLESIQKRIKRAEEQKHEVAINQVSAVLDKLFPDGSLQEREDNFLNFYINNPDFIDELVELLDPLNLRFNVLIDDA